MSGESAKGRHNIDRADHIILVHKKRDQMISFFMHPDKYDMLMDIATEEFSHLEIVGVTIQMLLKGVNGDLKNAAEQSELAEAFDKHLGETKTHIETLEKVFELPGEKAAAKKRDAMAGILEEAKVLSKILKKAL